MTKLKIFQSMDQQFFSNKLSENVYIFSSACRILMEVMKIRMSQIE